VHAGRHRRDDLACADGECRFAVIELLVLVGLVAFALLAAVGVLFALRQRRQGTVRAVLMPRRDSDDSAASSR
jgi:hypothetical protein